MFESGTTFFTLVCYVMSKLIKNLDFYSSYIYIQENSSMCSFPIAFPERTKNREMHRK